jgi:hypothetical protein
MMVHKVQLVMMAPWERPVQMVSKVLQVKRVLKALEVSKVLMV